VGPVQGRCAWGRVISKVSAVSPYWSRSRPVRRTRREWPPLGDGDPVQFDVFDRIAQWQVGDRAASAVFLDYIAPGSLSAAHHLELVGMVNIAVNACEQIGGGVVASDPSSTTGCDQLCLGEGDVVLALALISAVSGPRPGCRA